MTDYLDVGPAIGGGYRVARIRRGHVLIAQVLISSAEDVAAVACICGLPVITTDVAIIQACRALGVALPPPPPPYASSTCSERHP